MAPNQSTPPPDVSSPALTHRLTEELVDWVEGRRSWTNLIQGNYGNGPQEQATIAVMDAMEVVKRAAAVVALTVRQAR